MENNTLGLGIKSVYKVNYILNKEIANDSTALLLVNNLITSIVGKGPYEQKISAINNLKDYLNKSEFSKIILLNQHLASYLSSADIVFAKSVLNISLIRNINALVTYENVGLNIVDMINTLRHDIVTTGNVIEPDIDIKDMNNLSIAVLGNITTDAVLKELIDDNDNIITRKVIEKLLSNIVDNNNSKIDTRIKLLNTYLDM